ncbi:MotA/TolQ/ExbB proton channel family protein [Vibrio proteolyticus]|uniref:MotA/TolQ/ExbB proton channel domain-containing protein n=1 Tax=Vibrio proteolyticus NBRC 13287 TaxID=1219065 RepID=U3BK72_VIBPR|nr:MotA/TolQ/ExbB proton channel family protein [Vibrio proteolyticus]GAD67023.1 hypothetical protein VPR01S_06_00400 [Vibrio proteolyticus NBRC 13287]
METFAQLQQQLGLMTWPLLVCSALTAMIIAERLIQVAISFSVGKRAVQYKLMQLSPQHHQQLDELAEALLPRRPLLFKGVGMLLTHRHVEKTLREDAAGIWLQEQRHQLHSGLRLLTLVGVISPLLGLLGTVLGLIEMFQGMAASSGNVTPSDLADGLGIAMFTTAAGLLIALPAIVAAQLLGLWADRVMAKLEHTLNYVNLWLEGVNLAGPIPAQTHGTAMNSPVASQ